MEMMTTTAIHAGDPTTRTVPLDLLVPTVLLVTEVLLRFPGNITVRPYSQSDKSGQEKLGLEVSMLSKQLKRKDI